MEEAVPDASLPEGEETPSEKGSEKKTKKNSREPLFGILLLGVIVVFLLLAAAGIAWAIYGGVAQNQAEKNELSISGLGAAGENSAEKEAEKKQEATPAASPAPADTSKTPPASSATSPPAQTPAVSVLNGGATVGSAGKLVTALKQEGYTRITAGDTTTNYTGVVIYYAEAVAQEAESLKLTVIKTYPKVTIAKAITANAETTKSPLTVIIGR